MLHIKGELKHILIMLVLLFLLGIICLLSELYLNISCRQLEQELEKAESPQDLDAFDEIFDRITDIWLLIMPHEEVDSLSELYYNMYACSDEDFRQYKQALKHMLELIPDRSRLSLQNVF